jgi:hypothetical protein
VDASKRSVLEDVEGGVMKGATARCLADIFSASHSRFHLLTYNMGAIKQEDLVLVTGASGFLAV